MGHSTLKQAKNRGLVGQTAHLCRESRLSHTLPLLRPYTFSRPLTLRWHTLSRPPAVLCPLTHLPICPLWPLRTGRMLLYAVSQVLVRGVLPCGVVVQHQGLN